MRATIVLLAIWVVLAQPSPAPAQRDVDFLELAARLVGDGHYDRAERALQRVRPADGDERAAEYHTLRGLVALRLGRPEPAARALRRAVALRRQVLVDERIPEDARALEQANLYLGQAQFQLGQYADALAAFEAAGTVADRISAVHALRAQAHWELGQRVAALAALRRGARRSGGDPQFLRRNVFYLIEMGFHQRAAELGELYLKRAQPGPEDYVALGRALRQSGQHAKAQAILERGRLRFPDRKELGVELAHAYLDEGHRGVSADLLADTALRHPELRLEAAEMQREAGRLRRALMLSAGIADQKAKLRQRLSILIEAERWTEAAAMGGALRRHQLLESDEIRYALAYALFKTGDYDAADGALSGIRGGEMFRKALELRRVMESCRQNRWKCL